MLRQRQRAVGVGGNDRYRLQPAVGECPLPRAGAVAAGIVEQYRAQRCQRQPFGGLLLRRQVAPQMVERPLAVQRQQIESPAAGHRRRAAKRLPPPGNGEIDARAAQFDLALPRQAAVLPDRRLGTPRAAGKAATEALRTATGPGVRQAAASITEDRPGTHTGIRPAPRQCQITGKHHHRHRRTVEDPALVGEDPGSDAASDLGAARRTGHGDHRGLRLRAELGREKQQDATRLAAADLLECHAGCRCRQ